MNWEKIANQHSTLQEYRLTNNDNEKLVLKYNPLHQSARIIFEDYHRLFFWESAGSMSGKTIFRNEYGMETGYLTYDRFSTTEGNIVLDAKKYHYLLKEKMLTIYDKDPSKPLANCHFQHTNSLGLPDNNIDVTCYVIGMCWYLMLPLPTTGLFGYSTPSFSGMM